MPSGPRVFEPKASAIRFGVLLGMALLVASCGYRLLGTGSALPPEIRKVAIPLFVNQTSESGIENTFTNLMIREFHRNKRLQVVHDRESDAVLLGTIRALSISPQSYSSARIVVENRLTLYLDVVLKRKDSGEVLWRDPNLSSYQDYPVSSDISVSESNKQEALVKLAEVLCQRIHNRIFENF